jgi:hypothetical protein
VNSIENGRLLTRRVHLKPLFFGKREIVADRVDEFTAFMTPLSEVAQHR